MSRRPLVATGAGVRLVGWVHGAGAPVLLLHGGPGLSFEYLDSLAAEIGDGFSVAGYQQRGLTPSSSDGPFAVAAHVSDIRLVLDSLQWGRATLVGHSWGGHLALHAAVALPDRVDAVLAIDPLGAVGDGGEEEFEAAMAARTPIEARKRLGELDAKEERGEATEDDAVERLRLVWPAYFPTGTDAPAMPDIRLSGPCYLDTMASVREELPQLEEALPRITARTGFLCGADSPLPSSASTTSADRIDGAWVHTVDDAGHFPWLDRPGSVRAALARLSVAG